MRSSLSGRPQETHNPGSHGGVMTSMKLLRSAAAFALVLPITVAAMAAPASAAVATAVLADRQGPYPPYTHYTSYSGLNTSIASAEEADGLVEITTVLEYGEGEAAGTGIVLGGEGLVVTNHHVVEGATDITVTLPSTGETIDAKVLGYDVTKDVAVLQLEDASSLTAVATDPGSLTTGDAVTAVGDAGGDGGSLTAAPGVVSDLHHPITVQDDMTGADVPLRNLIEVTSDVVPGDSGGALLDAQGNVVGMNVAASIGGTDVTGYVVPIGRVLRVVGDVLAGDESGTVVIGATPFLGVSLADGSASLAGVVDGSPAADLGLSAGDAITGLDATAVSSAEQLRAAVAVHEPGDSVTVTWTDASGVIHSGAVTLVAGPVA